MVKTWNMTLDQLEFSTYCIGNVADAFGIDDCEAYNRLRKSGILLDYIVKHYDVLHTYSRRYITDDLTSLMKERGA